MRYAFAYLVCFQITVNHVHIASCQQLIDSGINLYIQKEQLTLLDDEGHPSLFAPIMIATLSTCAQLERENISFQLQSGRKRYIEKGGKLGRNAGPTHYFMTSPYQGKSSPNQLFLFLLLYYP